MNLLAVVEANRERDATFVAATWFIGDDDDAVAIDVGQFGPGGLPATPQSFGHEQEIIIEAGGDVGQE